MDIDLSRHAVVEASAGTGKTYTIERLVLRLLTEAQVPLEEILLVTFTEKATGELKSRLRRALEDEQGRNPSTLLEAALDQIDQASIFTIHGFCQRLLSEFPLEQGQEFQPQLVNGEQLLEPALREVQRRFWRRRYGDHLREVLPFAGYDRLSAEKWEERVTEIAGRLRPMCGDRILPELMTDWPDLERVEIYLRGLADRLRQLAERDTCDLEAHSWWTCLPKRFQGRADWGRILQPVLTWLQASDGSTLAGIDRLFNASEVWKKEGLCAVFARLPEEVCEPFRRQFSEVWQALAELDGCRSLRHQLAVHTIHLVLDQLESSKRQGGLQTFDDLIGRVARAFNPEGNPQAAHLLRRLRKRYRWGIVDEFQDTDPLQWQILRQMFAEEGRLVLVGDPKQAIYGFRGADLPTYLRARGELLHAFGAGEYPLDVNWRSSPALLEALNHLFEAGEWFAGPDIVYRRVQAPAVEQRPTRLVKDPTGRAALTLVEVNEDESKAKRALRDFARFTAREIQRLLAKPLTFAKDGRTRPLEPRDIAILVFKRAEAGPVTEEMRRLRIPFSLYKQTGLWQSDEAEHVLLILQALANPGDLAATRCALLTRFFRVRAEALALSEDISPTARELFESWQTWGKARQWSRLFRSLLSETGLLCLASTEELEDRELANYRCILADLEEAGYRDNLDLAGLLAFVEQQRAGNRAADADYQPVETQQSCVQILTIHACKGLEFPVVFLAGGFSTGKDTGPVRYRDDENRLVYDLDPNAEGKRRAGAERRAEESRLLYVALTRAMFKLFVPRMHEALQEKNYTGPVGKILLPALERSRVGELGAPVCLAIHHAEPETHNIERVTSSPQTFPSPSLPDSVEPDLNPGIGERRTIMRSFSSMHRRAEMPAQQVHFGEDKPKIDDDAQAGFEREDPLRGPVFGEIVHQVLEQIEFAEVASAKSVEDLFAAGTSARDLLDSVIAAQLPLMRSRTPLAALEEACRQSVARLVWHALRTPLREIRGPICAISAGDCLREVEFLFPEVEPRTLADSPPGLEEFFNGFMDLVFRKDGRYFLVDWKTNLLPGYGSAELQEAMTDNAYKDQYRLYARALARWLGKDAVQDFGGVYYLFLRGMNGMDESAGVYFDDLKNVSGAL